MGYMISFRNVADTKKSLNFGIGASVEPNLKTLGDGIQANQPLSGNDRIRYQDRTLVGITALVALGF